MENKASMEAFVVALLKTKLPTYLTYHNYHHTLSVQKSAIEIAACEKCTEAEIRLVSTAALWHDTGYLETNKGHEEIGCRLVREFLPGFNYQEAEITAICRMILATRIPQQPQSKLECIVADADLAYLGTNNAAKHAADLFVEMQHFNPGMNKLDWDTQQIHFLQQHRYFTDCCRMEKEPLKQQYLNSLLACR